MRSPVAGDPRSIGTYGSGCLAGAARLPLDGPGFHVANPERRRNFGPPELVDFVRSLGKAASSAGIGALMVGDLGLARGGPQPNGHASHQVGLDVDIWFAAAPEPAAADGKLSSGERRAQKAVPVADGGKQQLTPAFSPRVSRVLELAVADPRVERIFINPVIKRALCQAPGEHAWLHKLRPWWGHDAHFHVRLFCPKSSPECAAQAPLPAGDGCEQLDWWFSPSARADREEQHRDYQSRVGGGRAALPAACEAVLAAEDAPAPPAPKKSKAKHASAELRSGEPVVTR